MVSLCTGSPLPTFNSLYTGFVGNLTFPPMAFTFPVMPTLPSPMFPSISVPNLEAVKTVVELQSMQMLNTLMAMIQPMVTFLGGSLSALLPKIPGLNLNLIDLLSVNPQALFDAVKASIAALPPTYNCPFAPLPLYTALSIPDMSIVQIAANYVKSYSMLLVGFIEGLVSQVTSALHIGAMPTLPTMPTFNSIKSLILAKVPGATSLYQVLQSGISIPAMFNITIPGFPALPALPTPLVPSVNIPEFDFQESMGVLMNHLSTYSLSLVMNFINSTLASYISFTFPTFCITL